MKLYEKNNENYKEMYKIIRKLYENYMKII